MQACEMFACMTCGTVLQVMPQLGSETHPMIGKLLGHSNVTSTARYAHLDDSQVIAWLRT